MNSEISIIPTAILLLFILDPFGNIPLFFMMAVEMFIKGIRELIPTFS